MLRGLGSLGRSRSNWSRQVDLGVAGTLEHVSSLSYAALSVEQRNGLLVRFLASFSGIPEEAVAREFPVLIGKRFGRGRMARKINDAWLPLDTTRAQILLFTLEGELLAAANVALQNASPLAIRAMANIHAGVSPALTGVVALRSRKLIALGGRTIGEGIELGLACELGAMTPISIIGPIREQARVLAREVQSVDPSTSRWWLPSLDEEQELRDRVAIELADRGFVPRLSGSYLFDGRQSWMVGVEKIRRADLGKLMVVLLEILKMEEPDLSEHDSVDLAVCNGWNVEQGVTIPGGAASRFIEGALSYQELILSSRPYVDARLPLPICLSKAPLNAVRSSVPSPRVSVQGPTYDTCGLQPADDSVSGGVDFDDDDLPSSSEGYLDAIVGRSTDDGDEAHAAADRD